MLPISAGSLGLFQAPLVSTGSPEHTLAVSCQLASVPHNNPQITLLDVAKEGGNDFWTWQRMGPGGQAFIWSWLEVPACRRIKVLLAGGNRGSQSASCLGTNRFCFSPALVQEAPINHRLDVLVMRRKFPGGPLPKPLAIARVFPGQAINKSHEAILEDVKLAGPRSQRSPPRLRRDLGGLVPCAAPVWALGWCHWLEGGSWHCHLSFSVFLVPGEESSWSHCLQGSDEG